MWASELGKWEQTPEQDLLVHPPGQLAQMWVLSGIKVRAMSQAGVWVYPSRVDSSQ